VPLLYQQFDATPSALPAFSRLNEDLLPMVRSRTAMIPKLREFRRPVRITFGAADPYLNQVSPGRSMTSFRGLNCSLSPVLDTSSKWMSRNRWRGSSCPCQAQGASSPDACNEIAHRTIVSRTRCAGRRLNFGQSGLGCSISCGCQPETPPIVLKW
jgi:hypothetical protein